MPFPHRDVEVLKEFGIWPQILQIERTLRDVGRAVYRKVEMLLGSHRSVTPEDCVGLMATSLDGVMLVRTLLRSSLYTNESSYPAFREKLARCLLHHFWSEISR
jgi:hypothetical protein